MFTNCHHTTEDIFDSTTLLDKIKKIEENDVHLFSTNRNIYDEKKSYSQYFLSSDEQNRAKRFSFRKDHDLFVIGRYITRLMLAYYTDSTPENVKIIPDTFGKPACEMNIFFNISHSSNQLLLGFSNSKIGVDIERVDPTVNIERVSKRHFSKTELENLMKYSKDEGTEMFFEIWTQKESLIKGIGKGLSLPFRNFSVINRNGKVSWDLPVDDKFRNWFVQNIEVKEGFKSAFATQNEVAKLSYFSLENRYKQ